MQVHDRLDVALEFQRSTTCTRMHVVLVSGKLTADCKGVFGPAAFVIAQHDKRGYLVHDCGASPSCPLEIAEEES